MSQYEYCVCAYNMKLYIMYIWVMDLRFSRWSVQPHVVQWKFTDIWNRAVKQRDASVLYWLLGLIFKPEEGASMFFPEVYDFVWDYTTSQIYTKTETSNEGRHTHTHMRARACSLSFSLSVSLSPPSPSLTIRPGGGGGCNGGMIISRENQRN
jgi:hypothetical protein